MADSQTDGANYRVIELLRSSGMKPVQLARAINVNPNTIYALLDGRQMWKEFHFVRLTKAFPNINLHWVLTGEGERDVNAQL